MSQSQHQIDTGRTDTDDHTAGEHEQTELGTDDPATTAGGAHYTCRTHDDPRRARVRGLTAGPVVRVTNE
ncbi:hypothetical protein [Salinirubrum litoreum]|uniref:Uncharacterized protein n=1 Tax=Salinirubrum litoreum TaxID=1126234 RepID=A0ABD5R7N5_9EURY|nr:hypothetical protein [Salinirubrum litoreum]